MGELISMAAARAARVQGVRGAQVRRRPAPRVRFSFDLLSPWTYLVAERVDRLFPAVHWIPVLGLAPRAGTSHRASFFGGRERAAVEARAAELRMPLVWPQCGRGAGRGPLRVAAVAAEAGRAAPFVLAAGRLAFCGGFDLDDPEILAEAVAAAGLALGEALAAAGDPARDAALGRGALALRRRGADAPPALAVGHRLFCGEARLAEAAAAAAAAPAPRRRPAVLQQ
jgi:2-hydroxychromene-2-carboxylate isomerase